MRIDVTYYIAKSFIFFTKRYLRKRGLQRPNILKTIKSILKKFLWPTKKLHCKKRCILSLTRPFRYQNNVTFGNAHSNKICPLFNIREVQYRTILICLRISSTLLYPLFRYQCESLQFLKQSKGNEREKINGCFTRRARCVKTGDNYEIRIFEIMRVTYIERRQT